MFSFLKGNDVNFFLRRGDLDGGVGGDMPALTIASTDEVIIPIMAQQGFTSIVASKPMLISELRGKRIGFAYGSNAHFTVLDALASENMTSEDVELIAMETSEMGEALRSGRIAAFASWEPTPTLALALNPDFVTVHRSLSTGYLYFFRRFADEHPLAVRHIIAAQVRAVRALRDNPDIQTEACEWSCMAGEKLSPRSQQVVPESAALLLYKADILGTKSPVYVPESDLLDEGPLHREFEFLKALRIISAKSEWKAVRRSFDRDVLTDVLLHPETYSLNAPTLTKRAEK